MKNNQSSTRFMKYLFVVSIACLADFLIFNILYYFSSFLTLSNLIAFLIGNAIASILLQLYVFKLKKSNHFKQFYYSFLLSLFIFFIANLSLKILVDIFDMNVIFSKILTLMESFTFNFIIRNFYFIKNSTNSH